MPELPEVETIKRGLVKLIVGRAVKKVQVFDSPKSFPNSEQDVAEFLIGAKIKDVRRRAKVLLIDLDTGYTLVIHLKMTGQLVFVKEGPTWVANTSRQASFRRRSEDDEFTSASSGGAGPSSRFGGGHPNDSFIGSLPDKSTRVEIGFDDDSKLFFNDQRKFGWIKLFPSLEVPNIDFMKKVGPEPLEDDFTAKEFVQRIRRRNNTTVKAAILDQTVLAGVGNIYADESLYGAKIHPATRVREISDKQLAELLRQIKFVMNLSIEKGGSTDRNYIDAEGNKGSYLKFAQVFRREGQECPRHPGLLIEKTRVAGRGTHFCPACQVVKE